MKLFNIMKTKQTSLEKRLKIKQSQKVFGVPKLPQSIDAMYENKAGGSLIPYYYDPDPIRDDPTYEKLEKLMGKNSFIRFSKFEKVAYHLLNDMKSRQMKEKTYIHINRSPLWFLRLEFTFKYIINYNLRKEIHERMTYMIQEKNKKWLD